MKEVNKELCEILDCFNYSDNEFNFNVDEMIEKSKCFNKLAKKFLTVTLPKHITILNLLELNVFGECRRSLYCLEEIEIILNHFIELDHPTLNFPRVQSLESELHIFFEVMKSKFKEWWV